MTRLLDLYKRSMITKEAYEKLRKTYGNNQQIEIDSLPAGFAVATPKAARRSTSKPTKIPTKIINETK